MSIIALQDLDKDAFLEGHVWLVQDYKEGRIPATVLCNVRSMVKYFKAREPSHAGDLEAMALQIRAILEDLPDDEGALSLPLAAIAKSYMSSRALIACSSL